MTGLPKQKHRQEHGRNASGNQQYRCKDCGAYKVLEPTVRYGQERKEEFLRAYHERSNLRGISRTFGVLRPTMSGMAKKKLQRLPKVADGLGKARSDDALELDEVCGVIKWSNKVWTWTALCRRTRQIMAYVNGDRSEVTCKELWDRIYSTPTAVVAPSATSGRTTRASFPQNYT
jgi:insertion element IS1 protein InsB